jgi:hypothetical protein
MHFLLQRTGLISQFGKEERFIHETFREYLAASALARRYRPQDDDAWNYLRRWADKEWREVILFLLGIWSEDALDQGSLDVSEVLHQVSDAEDSGVVFAGTALAEGVRAQPAVEDTIVDRLITITRDLYSVREAGSPGVTPSNNSLPVLEALMGRERATKGLRELGTDPAVPFSVRNSIANMFMSRSRVNEAEQVLATTARYQGTMTHFDAMYTAQLLLELEIAKNPSEDWSYFA